MINYIKSEVYRTVRSKGNYIFLFGCIGFVVFINVALGIFAKGEVGFPYGNTYFSFSSFYTGMPIPMVLCVPLASIACGQEFKNHTLKNSISYGISRNQIYFGKFFMELVVALINLVLVSAAYIITAYIMLEDSGAMPINELFRAIIACIPLFLVSLTVFHCCYFVARSENMVVILWTIIMILVPRILSLLGKRIDVLKEVANCMPINIVGNITHNEETGRLIMSWSTQSGIIKCFLVGIIGTLIFYMIGLLLLKKTEIK